MNHGNSTNVFDKFGEGQVPIFARIENIVIDDLKRINESRMERNVVLQIWIDSHEFFHVSRENSLLDHFVFSFHLVEDPIKTSTILK